MPQSRRLAAAALAICGCAWSAASAQAPADPYNHARTSSVDYRADGLVDFERVEPDNAAICVKTSYDYDAYGNPTLVTTGNCAGATGRALFATRASVVSFGAQSVSLPGGVVAVPAGTFATSNANALQQQEARTYDPRFGVMTSLQDRNLLTTFWEYDDLGRKTREIHSDGTRSVKLHCYLAGRVAANTASSPGCPTPGVGEAPADAVFFVHVEPRDASGSTGVKNGPFSRTYVDRADRVLRVVGEAFDGPNQTGGASRLIVQDTDYNAQGIATLATEPYFLDSGSSTASGANDHGMRRTELDELGRSVTVYTADSHGSQLGVAFGARGARQAAWTRYAYNGLSTTVTNDRNNATQEAT